MQVARVIRHLVLAAEAGSIRGGYGALELLPIVLAVTALAGCAGAGQIAPRVQLTQLSPYPSIARGPDCNLPVLKHRPLGDYTELAIVEGWSSPDGSEQLLQQLKNKACETGADALVMLEGTSQTTKPHLYRPTPNQTSETVSGADASMERGAYLHTEEHIPKVGEAGHTGYYIDAVAIVYDHPRHDAH